MSDCLCTKTYTCLSCEDIANGFKKPKRVITRVVSTNRKVAECGTRAGYNRHLRLKEQTCPECRAAHTQSVITWKQGVLVK